MATEHPDTWFAPVLDTDTRQLISEKLWALWDLALMAVDDKGLIVFWNQAATELLGYNASEALNKPLHHLFVPKEQRDAIHTESVKGIGRFDGQTKRVTVITKRGRRVPVAVHVVATQAGAGTGTVRLAAVQPIDRDIAGERTAAQNNRMRRAILDAVPVPIYCKDDQGQYLDCNKAFRDIALEAGVEPVGRTLHDFTPKKTADIIAAKDARVFAGTEPTQVYEAPLLCQDGKVRVLQFHKAQFEFGASHGLVGAMLDVTELRREQALHATLTETAPLGVAVVTEDGVIEYANQMLGHLTGSTPENLVGCQFDDLFAAEERAAIAERVRRRAAGEIVPTVYQAVARRADGAEAHWEIHAIRMPLPDGVHIHKIVVDVTERHKREDELRRALDAAEAADRAKTAFIDHISHELRTPLNAILGFSDLCLSSIDETHRPYIGYIKEGGQKLRHLVDELLDLAEAGSGTVKVSPACFSLIGLVSDLMSRFVPEANQAGIELLSDIQAMPQCVFADETLIGRVISNLLSNAIKFTPAGGKVTVAAKHIRISETDAALEIAVTDTGIGIDQADQRRLLQPFEVARNVHTGEQGGIGLGLTISRQLVTHMRGTLSFTSQVGQGSRFCFTIPVPINKTCQPALPQALENE